MKFLIISLAVLATLALAQEQPSEETTVAASTTSSPDEEPADEDPIKYLRPPFGLQFPFRPYFVPIPPRPFNEKANIQQVQNPFEYNINDQLSVQPYLTFPPNFGGGLNFRYHF